ncbi:MAG: HD domain-containing phosphohydrolase [Thermoleophilia bacterium]
MPAPIEPHLDHGANAASNAVLGARVRNYFRDLAIRRKIIIPFLLLLGVIALVGTPLASDFVSGVIEREAGTQLVSRIGTVQEYFELLKNDLSADAQTLGLRPDLAGAIAEDNTSYLEGALVAEKSRHAHDFILVFRTDEDGERLVVSDTKWGDPSYFASQDLARYAALEATYVQVVDLFGAQPAGLAPADASPSAEEGAEISEGHRVEPSRFALVAAAPIKSSTKTIGYVVVGNYLNPKFLYNAAKAAGGFRTTADIAYPQYIISFYAVTPDGQGTVVASSGEYSPRSETYLTPDDRVLAVVKSPYQAASCDACHTAAAAAQVGDLDKPTVSKMNMAEGRYMVVHSKLVLSGVQQGVFSILSDMQDVAGTQSTARNSLLIGTLVLLALIVVIGQQVSRAITRPITQLSVAAGAILEGRPGVIPPLAGKDEIGQLSRSIATMTSTLQENAGTIQARLEEMSLLYAFSSAANSTLDLREILQTLLQSTARVLGADSGTIMMVSRSGAELQIMAAIEHHHLLQMDKRVPITDGVAGWVAQHRQSLILPRDFENHPELADHRRGDIQAALCIPVENKDSVVGVLNLNSSDPNHTFTDQSAALVTALANQAAVAIDNATMFQTLTELHGRVVRALGAAIDAKDRYTQGHSTVVAHYGVKLAACMGFSEAELEDLEIAGYLHDLGKIGIHDDILNKEGRLTAEERNVIRTHPVIGATIIEPVGFPWEIVAAVRHHHEWWNGQGYPDGLRGTQIPLGARILSVVDAFEAMTATRPYKPAMNFEEAWMEISRMAGTQFDPDVVESFLSILDTLTASQPLAQLRA